MYDLRDYAGMIADEVRMRAYSDALTRHVTPGCTVLDLGTGVGLHAMMACRLGAAKVFAIETNDAIQVAREHAVANGYADRMVFIHKRSELVSLPAPVDVIVSDLRGALPLFGRHVATIADARQRFLAANGVLLPACDRIFAALVEAPSQYGRLVGRWTADAHAFDLSAARSRAVNAWYKERLAGDQLISAPAHWWTVDYSLAFATRVTNDLTFVATRQGNLHGIALWFDAEISSGIGFSNAPGASRTVYSQGFFPLPRAVDIAEGDVVTCRITAAPVGDEYVWIWHTRVFAGSEDLVPKAQFEQSTFAGHLFARDDLQKRAHSYVPATGGEAAVERSILAHFNGRTSLGDIATLLRAEFPARFQSWEEALTRVGNTSVAYSDSVAPAIQGF